MDAVTFEKWLRDRGFFNNQYNTLESLQECREMVHINKMLYPQYGYRLRYDDTDIKAYFPDCNLQIELIDLPKKQVEAANTFFSQLLAKAKEYRDKGNAADYLVADLRYRQCVELLKVMPLAQLAVDYINQGKSVIIFVNFKETLFSLSQLLKCSSVIYGEQKQIDRLRIIEAFQQNKTRLIIATYSAGGQSLSLHDLYGNHQRVSLICPMYHAIALKQIQGRTRRAKSQSVPILKLCYAAGTVEEKVASNVQSKIKNIDSLNDGDLFAPELPPIERGE